MGIDEELLDWCIHNLTALERSVVLSLFRLANIKDAPWEYNGKRVGTIHRGELTWTVRKIAEHARVSSDVAHSAIRKLIAAEWAAETYASAPQPTDEPTGEPTEGLTFKPTRCRKLTLRCFLEKRGRSVGEPTIKPTGGPTLQPAPDPTDHRSPDGTDHQISPDLTSKASLSARAPNSSHAPQEDLHPQLRLTKETLETRFGPLSMGSNEEEREYTIAAFADWRRRATSGPNPRDDLVERCASFIERSATKGKAITSLHYLALAYRSGRIGARKDRPTRKEREQGAAGWTSVEDLVEGDPGYAAKGQAREAWTVSVDTGSALLGRRVVTLERAYDESDEAAEQRADGSRTPSGISNSDAAELEELAAAKAEIAAERAAAKSPARRRRSYTERFEEDLELEAEAFQRVQARRGGAG